MVVVRMKRVDMILGECKDGKVDQVSDEAEDLS